MDKGNASVKKGRKKQRPKRAQNQPDVENSSSTTQIETSVTVPPSVVAFNTSGVSAKSTSGSSIDISPKLSGEGQSENTEEYKEGTPGTDSQEGSKSKNKKKHKKNKKKTNPVATEGKEISNDQTCKEPKALQSTNTGNLLTSNSELPSNNKNNKTSPQDVTKTQSGKKSKKSRKRTNQNTGLNEECKILSNLQESCDNFLCTHKESECVKHKKVATEFSNKFDISSLHFLTENSFDFSKNSASDEEKSIATPAFKNSEPDLVDFGKPLQPKPHFLTEIEFTALDQLKNIRKLAHDTNLSERLFSTYSFKENQVSDCFKELTIPVFTHSVGEPVFSEELKTLQKNREVAREARQHFKPKNIFDLSNLTASSYADSPDECRITELDELSDINVKTDSSGEKLLDDPFVKDTNRIHNIRHYFDFSSKSKFEPYSFATQDFASEIRLFSPSISSLQQELKESTDQLKTFMECFPPEVEASPTFGEDLKNFSDENNTSDSDSKTSSPNKSTLLFEIKSPGFTNFDHFNQPKANPYLSKETFNAAVGSKHGNNLSQPCTAVVSPEDDFPCQKLEQDHSSEKTNSNDSVKIQELIPQSETEGNYVLFESGNILNDWYTAKCTSPVEQSEYPESLNQPESAETMENQHPPKSDSENAGSVLPEDNRTLSSPVKDNQKKLPGKVRTESTRMAKETEEKSSPSEPSENAVMQKKKAELKAERRAIQEAQRAAKTEKKKNEGTYNQKKSEQDGGSPTSSTEAGETVKSKAELRAERRALQEAQRAAKAAKKAEEGSKAAPKKPEAPATAAESRRGSAISSDKQKDAKSSKESTPSSVTQVFPQRTKVQRKVQLFEHLHQYEREVSLTQGIPFGSGTVHPAVIRLGLQYAEGVICGSNARCVALLLALKEVIQDYVTPPQKELSRDLEGKLERYSSFLQHCRPISVSMSNAIKSLKWQITHIPNGTADHEAKKELLEAIENYIQENIVLADKAIAALAIQKINDGDVILTYSYSSVINSVLKNAHDSGKKFRVVVMDGRPKMEGKKTLVDLIKQGIKCSYVLINAVSYIMREVTKVFLGAHALLANGYVMSRVGSSQIALVAKAYNVPVLVCCETHKFSERVQTDSFVFNELGDPDDLVQTHTKHTYLADWRDIQTFNLLNLVFDVTSPDLISAVVTELGMIPCTSVPVVLRVKHPKN